MRRVASCVRGCGQRHVERPVGVELAGRAAQRQDDQAAMAELVEHGDLLGQCGRVVDGRQWPSRAMRARLTIWVRAPASGATDGARINGEKWCSETLIQSKPSSSASAA